MTPAIDLSIVIPAYNEAGRIGPTLDRLIAALDPLPLPWEILVADDGSTDDTAAIVGATAAREPRVRVLRLPHRGKGATLRDGLLAAAGTRRFLCDADLSMPPAQIGRFLAVLPSQCDIAIGSREGAGAVRIGEPLHRHLLGRVFNTLVRAMVLPGIQDTQCGFKLFTAEAVQAVLPTTAIDGWSFDVELLASARAQGWRIREVPIEWHYGQASRLRVLPHSFEMLRDLFRIRAKIRRGAFARPAERRPAGAAGLARHEPAPAERSSNAPMRLLPFLLLAAITLGAQAPAPRLTPANVGGLVEAWTYDTRESTDPVPPARRKPAFEATPVYVDGRLYLSTPGGLVIALDAETGAEAWRVDLAVDCAASTTATSPTAAWWWPATASTPAPRTRGSPA